MTEPADQLAVFLPGNRAAFEPGETLATTVLWACARAPGELRARLFWITRGKGTEDLEIVSEQVVRADVPAGETGCTFDLPCAPWSFSGKLISVIWGVEVVAAQGLAARSEFVLAPDRSEIRLSESAAAPR